MLHFFAARFLFVCECNWHPFFVAVVCAVCLFFLLFAFCFCFLPFAFFQFLIKRIFAARQQCEAKKEQEKNQTAATAREGKICVQQIIMNKKKEGATGVG